MKECKQVLRKLGMVGIILFTIGNTGYTVNASTIKVFTRTVIQRNFPQNSVIESNIKEVPFSEGTGKPTTFSGRTYVPLKVIGDQLDIQVGYNSKTRATEIDLDGKKLELFNDSYMAKIDGQWKALDVRDGQIVPETKCRIINGRTYVPVRFVSEELGLNVVSNGDSIYLDTVEKLTKIEDMVPGKKYSIGEILYKPLQSYQPNWSNTFSGAFNQKSGEFNFEKNTLTRYTNEQVKQGVFISPDVKLYGARLEGNIVKVEISKPVHPQVIFFECSPELNSDELRGYSLHTGLEIEKLPNGNYLAGVAEYDSRNKNIKHLGVRMTNEESGATASDTNTIVIDVNM